MIERRSFTLLFAISVLLSSSIYAQNTVIDYDGDVYNTVTIGSRTWLKENLRVTHYTNGDTIPNVIDTTSWSNLTTGNNLVEINSLSQGSYILELSNNKSISRTLFIKN